jgi:hypothetical protein
MTDGSDLRELQALSTRLAQRRQAEILIYSGELVRPGDGDVALRRHDHASRARCLLLLRTLGGSADAGYRLARTLKRQYRRLTVIVDDYCKGAGMLLALAADELVISDFGELGPLDLTSQRAVTPGRGESGLALVHSMEALRAETEAAFERHLARFRSRRNLSMTTRSAIEQASALSVGLMGQVFSQIDPLQIAEADRARRTATLYVQRLGTSHLKDGALDRLLTGYPSHDFVIDREEAEDLLRTVRAPTTEESVFLTHAEPLLGERRLRGRLLQMDEALRIVEAAGRSWPPHGVDGRIRDGDAEAASAPGELILVSNGPDGASG